MAILNQVAELKGIPSVIFIDAINENGRRSQWKKHLLNFSNLLKDFPLVRLAISCRSDFVQATLPPALSERREPLWYYVEHDGFHEEIFDAVKTYFNGYNIQCECFPPLLPELSNPLFLKTLCEAFADSTLKAHHLTLKIVVETRIRKLCDKLHNDIDCSPHITKKAIELITSEMAKSNEARVNADKIHQALDTLLPARGDSESLYKHLCSNGLLVEIGGQDELVYVRFQFERFTDYFLAKQILDSVKNFRTFRAQWKSKLGNGIFVIENSGLIKMLAILLPEKFGVELASLWPLGRSENSKIDSFISSISWRSPNSFSDKSKKLILHILNNNESEYWMHWLFPVCVIPKHPYNADFLHHLLERMNLSERECVWTIPINNQICESYSPSAAENLVNWAASVPLDVVSDEQALLASKLIGWFFSSTHREFRDKATLATIRLLVDRSHIASMLVNAFQKCDDPYVLERVYAVAAGVAMREKNAGYLKELAVTVYNYLFNKGKNNPHILMREYGRCVIEIAFLKGAISKDKLLKARPPYKSVWPKIPPESQSEILEKKDEFYTVINSMRPQSLGYYGDFGRYEMESNVHHFQKNMLSEKPCATSYAEVFDSKIAYRWILQRIVELGWNPKFFKAYEAKLLCLRGDRPIVERIF